MHEKIKTWIYNNRFFVGLVIGAAIFCAYYLSSIRSTGTGDNVGGTLQRAQDDNQRAGAAVGRAQSELDAAGAELTGANRNAERAAGIVGQNADAIKKCRELVERSRENNRRAERIFADIERANQTSAGGE